ncbi:hypothetical protein V6Z12_A07G000500 [Gossypium hirsutum]
MSPAIKLHRFVPSSSVEFWLRSTPGITSYLEKSGFGFYVIHILCSFWKMLLSFCVLYCLFSISLGNGVLAFPSFRRSGVCHQKWGILGLTRKLEGRVYGEKHTR